MVRSEVNNIVWIAYFVADTIASIFLNQSFN